MIHYKTAEEIELLRKSNLLVSKALAEVDAELASRTFKIPKDIDIKFRNVTFK